MRDDADEREERRRQRLESGTAVPRAIWWDRFRLPGWYRDPAVRRVVPQASTYLRLWDGWAYGWTQCTRRIPGWYPDPDGSGWYIWHDGDDWDFGQQRRPAPEECVHPVDYDARDRRSGRRFCDLCRGWTGPCPHRHTRTWRDSTRLSDSWACDDCGAVRHGQIIPAPGTPGNPGF